MRDLRQLDSAAVAAALSPARAVDAITGALRSGLDPGADTPRSTAHTRHGHFLLMPSESARFAGVKIATVSPDNPASGLPRIHASYLLFDARTLVPKAILDGVAVTNLRTPAVAVAAALPFLRRFAEPLRVVVFGAGPQAVAHVNTLADVLDRPFERVTFVVRNPRGVAADARQSGNVLMAGAAEMREAVATAHVVVCATTARIPLFDSAYIAEGTVVLVVGSHEPDAREVDGALLARSLVIVEDVATALREAGDIVLARDEGTFDPSGLVPMADVVNAAAVPSDERPIVVKTVGMSWEDLVIAEAAYDAVVGDRTASRR